MGLNNPSRRTFLKRSLAVAGGTAVVVGTASAATPPVVAFDIDGSLTRSAVRDEYEQRRSEGDTVGVVTARTDERAQDFIQEYNLDPAFVRTAYVKFPALNDVEGEYGDAQSYRYVGSWFRDYVAALIAGWEYTDGGEL